jgi:hypothetical protein
LPEATAADVAQLPRLYTAAGMSAWAGRAEAGAAHSRVALSLFDARYDPFPEATTKFWAGLADFAADGDLDRWLAVIEDIAACPGAGPVIGGAQLLYRLPTAGRAADARDLAPAALELIRAHGNPVWVTLALLGAGRAFAETDPAQALDAFRQAVAISQEQRITLLEARAAEDSAGMEAIHGDAERALDLLDTAIVSTHLAGNRIDCAAALAELAFVLDRCGRLQSAAVVYGSATHYAHTASRANQVPALVEQLRTALGAEAFDAQVARGAAMATADAVAFAREQIRKARTG